MQSKYSLPTESGFTPTAENLDLFRPGGSEGSMIVNLTRRTQSIGTVIAESVEDDMLLAVLSRKLKTKDSTQADAFMFSCEGRPNPNSHSSQDESGWVLSKETLQRVPWIEIVAIGPADPLRKCRKSYCMKICRVNVSIGFCGIYEIKGHWQSSGHLQTDGDRYFLEALRKKDARVLYGCVQLLNDTCI